MSASRPPGAGGFEPTEGDRSVGAIVGDITKDFSNLVRQEMELAKTEMKQEVAKAGKGAGMLGGAGFAGYLTVLFVSLFVMFALGNWWNDQYVWSSLVVAAVWGVVAAVLAVNGRKKLQEANPQLPTTQRTLKEDAQWARAHKN